MKRIASVVAVVTTVLLLVPATIRAQAPLASSGVEVFGNPRSAGVAAQYRGDTTGIGFATDLRFDARRFRIGPTLSETVIRTKAYELRAPLAFPFTNFLGTRRWSVAGSIGLRNVIRTRFIALWLGPELSAATTIEGPADQRFTPAMETGLALGGLKGLPALAVRGQAGYTIGGAGRGSVAFEAWLSVVFDGWFEQTNE